MDFSGVKLKSIIFDKNSFDVKFKNTTVTLSDISEIQSVQSYDSSDLNEDIKKLKTVLSEYPIEDTKPISEFVEHFQQIEDTFLL